MRRPIALMAPMACAVALCVALTGCGGGNAGNGANGTSAGSEQKSEQAAYVGYWEAESMRDGDDEIGDDDLDMLRELGGAGSNCIVHLADDGTGTVDSFGDVSDVTWDAASKTVSMDGESMDIELKDGKLVLSQGTSSITFTKGADSLADQIALDRQAAEEGPSGSAIESGTDTGAVAEAIDPIVVADDDLCTITVTEKAVDDWGDAGYTVEIQNKSDRRINVWVPSGVTAVDGTMDELYGTSTLLPGANATTFFYFSDIDSTDGLTNVQTRFSVYDTDTYDDLAAYDVTIP